MPLECCFAHREEERAERNTQNTHGNQNTQREAWADGAFEELRGGEEEVEEGRGEAEGDDADDAQPESVPANNETGLPPELEGCSG